MKSCFKCNETKPLSDFYPHKGMIDGHLNKCKSCTKKDVRGNRAVNVGHYREYDRKRASLPNRVEARKEQRVQYKSTNPEKHKAWDAVETALRKGTLVKEPCAVCGTTQGVAAHHADYSQPLMVKWLCCVHHSEEHHQQETNKRLMVLVAQMRLESA